MKWKLPEKGVIKANCDAGLYATTQRMSIGVVVRDSTGAILACLSSLREFEVPQPTLVECWVLRRASAFYSELDLQSVQLEGDALTVIKAA